MTEYIYFFLGFIIAIILIAIFWYFSTINITLNTAYKNSFCHNICDSNIIP